MQKVGDIEYKEVEKSLNAHMSAWVRIFQGDDRTGSNYQATHNAIPPLYGLRKDHKHCEDQVKGPPIRPVCGAVVSCNYRISHFLSMILRPLVEQAEETCESTEDLLSKIKECNESENLTKSIVGSMDVTALYPSIDVDFAVDKCIQLIDESDMEFINIDTDELGSFLMMTNNKEELQTKDLLKYCPARITKRGRAPKLTASGVANNKEKRWTGWTKSDIKPGSLEIKKLVTLALRTSLLVTMKNHICQIDNNVYKQTQGGEIDVGIAGDVATLFMVWWDRELKNRLRRQSIKVQLYKRYVDDTNLVVKTVPRANEQPNDKLTMETIQKVANEIHPSISVTIDFPTNHVNNKMPVLDLELWIGMVEVDGSMKHQILFSHYMKPMANKYLINNRSALSATMKNKVLVADLVRIMRNVSLQCPESERQKHIQHFIKRMQFSGYHQRERVKVYNEAKRRFEKIIERDRKGECPMYRRKFWERRQREQEKINKKRTWYTKEAMKQYFSLMQPQAEN